MDYSTPGVYIREVDSGAKPIASVATSIPGFIGLFKYEPAVDAIAVVGENEAGALTGKVPPQLVDSAGKITDAESGNNALVEAFDFKPRQVKNLKKLMEINGHKATFAAGKRGHTKVTVGKEAVEVSNKVLSTEGAVVSDDQAAVEALLNDIGQTFALDKPKAKHARDLLEVYGFSFKSAAGTSLNSEYSVAPEAVTNKSQFFRWLQSYFSELLLSTRSVSDLVGREIADPDEAADAVFEALTSSADLKDEFTVWLSQPGVFNLVTGMEGFFNNGGGKAYVYLMGCANPGSVSVVENQADKLGLYAFDDCEDIALMVAPGLSPRQQKQMLELCEIRKDRFAILDGPLVSKGDMDIPASDKGYGAIYVPWFKIGRPSWFTDSQDHLKVAGPLRRKLIKAGKDECYVPPSGFLAGLYARVDGNRGVHKAPANEVVMGITGLSQNINKLEQGQYNNRGINCTRDFGDRGIRVWGARTLGTASDPSWKYINVRRLFIMVEQSIMLGSQWSVFEPNDQTLWKKLTRDVRAYLLRVWRSGALFGATPEEAFYVKCDSETNPRYLIDAGQVNVSIGICPVKPAEFVVFSIGQWDGGALIDD